MADKPIGRWISVNDRMPPRYELDDDECEYVLVYLYKDMGWAGDYKYITICAYDKDGWSKYDNFGCIDTSLITHWMPLPEPPKED